MQHFSFFIIFFIYNIFCGNISRIPNILKNLLGAAVPENFLWISASSASVQYLLIHQNLSLPDSFSRQLNRHLTRMGHDPRKNLKKWLIMVSFHKEFHYTVKTKFSMRRKKTNRILNQQLFQFRLHFIRNYMFMSRWLPIEPFWPETRTMTLINNLTSL